MLVETICYNKKANQPIINSCGSVKKILNFSKSKKLIFVRGTGIDSTKKYIELMELICIDNIFRLKGNIL